MSLAITKTNFEQLIDDRDNGVIALSGKWGSGKSHMWREVQKDSTNEAIKNALYVSLFGVKDILQLKMKIVQSAVPNSKTGHVAREVITSAWRESSKFLKTLHPGFAAIDEIALLAVPAILRKRVIVIDDIERKHAALSIDEVMGFIDEFTQVYDSRILLILNSDQLDDKAMWDKLREKVIDHEIALETTPAEAFGIAIGEQPSPYASHIQGAVETCKISNIRIIQKIIRSVNRLFDGRADLDDEVLQRAVPSTVLMCAIHYRGLEDGPSVDFVLNFNGVIHAMEERQRPPDANDEEVAKEKRWAQLLESLSIRVCDEYEHMVVAFLKSGLRIEAEVKSILDRYVAEKDAFGAQTLCRRFHELNMWHPLLTNAELLAEATAVAQVARKLDGYTVSSLHETISELLGGASIADAMLADWLRAFNAVERTEFRHDSIFDRPLHPAIKTAFIATERRVHPAPSLVDACLRIASGSWGGAERAALQEATPKSYQDSIKSLAGEDLRKFMKKNIDLYVRRAGYETDFGDAMENFAKACRSICCEDESSRLSRLVRLLFVHAKVGSVLDVHDWPRPMEVEPAAAPPPAA
ncbi:NTPase KAP [Janthinobacterium sp. BJB412]|nr:NTPase KAP [Janthinobacterium sp. BJB412]